MIKSLCIKIKKHKNKIVALLIIVTIIVSGLLIFKNSINTIISDTVELK